MCGLIRCEATVQSPAKRKPDFNKFLIETLTVNKIKYLTIKKYLMRCVGTAESLKWISTKKKY